jgi:hypothetical protein
MGSHLSPNQNADVGKITVQGHPEQNIARPHLNQINWHIVAGNCINMSRLKSKPNK